MSPQPVNGKPAPKAPRKRNAPKHLLDGSNSEAPSAAHQAIVDATQARLNAEHRGSRCLLPTTVAEGTDEDEIHRVLTTVHGLDEDSPASTFTRRFDILFKEDAQCRDTNGRLHLIRRGELGMLMVVRYLREINGGAVIKLERVVTEMEVLCGMDRSAARTAADARKSTSAAASKQKGKTKSANSASANSEDPAKEAMFLRRIRPHKDRNLCFSASSVRMLDRTSRHEKVFFKVLGRDDGLVKGFSRVSST
ncbi:hypothetical protein B0H10DRAFT_1974312 [Mycena sp. CBHHK59/15]|nr:hypothetical protein B0H10DRAFT_1974312 [Mycena sp. CBHHK59/15]